MVFAILLTMCLSLPDVASASNPGERTPPSTVNKTPITVFAAASLRESLDAFAKDWLDKHGQRVVVSYAATSALARHIRSGAPADLFISADVEWMDWLGQQQLIVPTSRIDLVTNKLVLIAPRTDEKAAPLPAPIVITPALNIVARLGKDGRLAVADPAAVPAGRYAEAALTSLGLWPALQNRLARAENVRAALLFVARGEAPLGIVYRTDALAEPRVTIVGTFPAASHPRIVYPAALVRPTTETKYAAARMKGAEAFLRALITPQAAQRWRGFGFVPIHADSR
jgi:molybdate transport system substrate-binding protein